MEIGSDKKGHSGHFLSDLPPLYLTALRKYDLCVLMCRMDIDRQMGTHVTVWSPAECYEHAVC